ncbi:hypothetical protein SRB5_44020 [Streptomyces sp. RB5]|uniref:Uncharacterized protein n=1 Tax=Streptomyces smaragdinus TaxID=2585196 RepID=A0A7K0CL71_9ACTN|nr:hypothetical protein [Streptomyces smaragdinus]MQY14240.1 hypothetical protein [Streptomyces smaragdinus]
MSDVDFSRIASSLTDSEVARILERSGWEKFGGQETLYSRWRPRDSHHGRGVLLPENQSMADYRELFVQAISQIWDVGDASVKRILGRAVTSSPLGDEVRFHKEAHTISGTIPWPSGEDLYSAARRSMIVAAKSRKSRLPYYGNANSYIARSFLDSVLMGQTDVGSYVVTAYVPPDEVFTEKMIPAGSTVPLLGSHSGREITKGLMEVLQTTREAVDHFTSTGSSHGFIENVRGGLCYEITQAVRDLVRNSDGAEVSVEMHLAADLFAPPSVDRHTLAFTPADYPILEKAGNMLAATARPQNVTVIGTVTLLNRPTAGSPGVVRLDVMSGTPAKKMRVRLKVEDYDLAVDAHRDNLALKVSGRQEIEGRYYWLYEPTEVELIPLEGVDFARISEEPTLPFFGSEDE